MGKKTETEKQGSKKCKSKQNKSKKKCNRMQGKSEKSQSNPKQLEKEIIRTNMRG